MYGITSIAKALIAAGIVLIVFGGLVLLLARVTGGRGALLPGDIVIRKGHSTFCFPVVTCIVLSIVMTIAFRVMAALKR